MAVRIQFTISDKHAEAFLALLAQRHDIPTLLRDALGRFLISRGGCDPTCDAYGVSADAVATYADNYREIWSKDNFAKKVEEIRQRVQLGSILYLAASTFKVTQE